MRPSQADLDRALQNNAKSLEYVNSNNSSTYSIASKSNDSTSGHVPSARKAIHADVVKDLQHCDLSLDHLSSRPTNLVAENQTASLSLSDFPLSKVAPAPAGSSFFQSKSNESSLDKDYLVTTSQDIVMSDTEVALAETDNSHIRSPPVIPPTVVDAVLNSQVTQEEGIEVVEDSTGFPSGGVLAASESEVLIIQRDVEGQEFVPEISPGSASLTFEEKRSEGTAEENLARDDPFVESSVNELQDRPAEALSESLRSFSQASENSFDLESGSRDGAESAMNATSVNLITSQPVSTLLPEIPLIETPVYNPGMGTDDNLTDSHRLISEQPMLEPTISTQANVERNSSNSIVGSISKATFSLTDGQYLDLLLLVSSLIC